MLDDLFALLDVTQHRRQVDDLQVLLQLGCVVPVAHDDVGPGYVVAMPEERAALVLELDPQHLPLVFAEPSFGDAVREAGLDALDEDIELLVQDAEQEDDALLVGRRVGHVSEVDLLAE